MTKHIDAQTKLATKLNIARTVVRIAVGALFCLSAVAKMSDFDRLELYIFSFGALSLNVSFWIARLLVAFEIMLGIALITNIYRRVTAWCALGSVIAFSAFLLYAIAAGRSDNCHCMGEVVELTPWQSLTKNALLVAALGFVLPQRGGIAIRKWITGTAIAVISLAIFVISPPDNINPYRSYNRVLNSTSYNTLPHNNTRRVVCFYSTSCKYCELASSKIASIARRHGLEQNIEVWFADMGGHVDSLVGAFYERTLSPALPYRTLDIRTFLTTTNGEMPIVLLCDGDSIATEFNYRTIDEDTIVNFLQTK